MRRATFDGTNPFEKILLLNGRVCAVRRTLGGERVYDSSFSIPWPFVNQETPKVKMAKASSQ